MVLDASKIALKALRLASTVQRMALGADRVAFKPLGTALDGSRTRWNASRMALEALRMALTAERMALRAGRLAFKPLGTALTG